MQKDTNTKFKICLFGDSGVGKTAFIKRWLHLNYPPEAQSPTLGAGCFESDIYIEGKQVHIQVWDTAGEEKYRSMVPIYIRGASGILLLFSLTDKNTFLNVSEWISAADTDTKPIILLIGNKNDLVDNREVTYQQALDFATQRGLDYMETSAQTGYNVDNSFITLVSSMMYKATPPQNDNVTNLTVKNSESACC